MVTHGWASVEVEQSYKRARELSAQLGETPEFFPILVGLETFYLLRGELQTARELSEQALRFALKRQDPTFLGIAHFSLATVLIWMGESSLALTHLREAFSLYDPHQV
jgi:tetratricopeptide (TPR) repeat protein